MGNNNKGELSHHQQMALSQQLQAHERVLKRFIALHVKDPADVEGRVQDTMVAAWQAYGEFTEGCTFKSWLCGIAKRQIANYYRQPNNQLDCLPFDDAVGAEETLTDNPCQQEAEAAELRKHLQALPEHHQQVIELHALKGYTHVQVGTILGIGKRAARVRYHRALEQLRQLILGQ